MDKSLLTTTVLQFATTANTNTTTAANAAAHKAANTYNYDAKIFAFIAAVAVGLLKAFDLGTKSNNVTIAWRKLNEMN